VNATVDFRPNDIQRAIEQAAAGALDGTGGDSPERAWQALGQAGLLSLAVPTSLGGEGLGAPEVGTLLTEVGRRALPLPALSTVALAVLPVAHWGTADQQRDLLSAIGTDGRVLTAALREPSDPMPSTPTTCAKPDLTVTGTKIGVWYAEQAHRILVPVTRPTGDTSVALIDPAGPGVSLRRTPTSSGLPEYTVHLDNAPATGLLGCGADALYRYAIAGACALGDGLLAGALALTTTHVGTREQFGRPLATFQAVAQQIADLYIASRTTHLTALAAGWRPDSTDVDVAAYWFTSTAPAAIRTCHHLHGGLGLDMSYPLHRYSAQIKDLVRFLGGTDYCLDRLSQSTGDDGRCLSN
jgi:alkylation response protein AidB-like acyl-CoA dehydrogenase